MYKSRGDYDKAEALFLQALEINKKAAGSNQLRLANSFQ
jgi:hypothetical protein